MKRRGNTVIAFCRGCGQHARADNRCCVGCGPDIDRGAESSGTGAASRPPEHAQRRAGGFLVGGPRGLVALAVIAAITAVVALTGCSSNTTPGPADTAPTPSVPPKERVVTTEGAGGRTYSCAFGVLDRVDAAKDRVTRRRKVLKARRAAVRSLEKHYPSGTAPHYIVIRYDKLAARANAQVTWTNKAIHEYNRVLRHACNPA
jgi:hypothetical protein